MNKSVVLLLLTASAGFGQVTYTDLLDFTSTNGASPESALTELDPGVFAGTTSISGYADAGTIFKLTSGGAYGSIAILNSGTQGASPVGQLFPASNGFLYGAAQSGGPNGTGAILRISPAGAVTVVTANVISPSPVVEATDGNVYFTAYNSNATLNISRMTLAGALTVLYTFPAGYQQSGPLVQASDGNLYGEVAQNAPGNGSVYRISLAGSFSFVYNFTGSLDGAQPIGGLTAGNNGLLYGVTNSQGANGSGTVFSLTYAGQIDVLHAFSYFDGESPLTGMIQASDNNLYGTNAGIGSFGPGTVFRIAPDGSNFTTVFNFPATSYAFAQVPGPGVIQGSDGKLYGTTLLGGVDDLGQVFSLGLGLSGPKPSIIRLSPNAGAVGGYVLITGRNLVGPTKVTFNGTPATAIVSRGMYYVVAQVPAGATSGPVTVTTANGSAQSAGIFTVD